MSSYICLTYKQQVVNNQQRSRYASWNERIFSHLELLSQMCEPATTADVDRKSQLTIHNFVFLFALRNDSDLIFKRNIYFHQRQWGEPKNRNCRLLIVVFHFMKTFKLLFSTKNIKWGQSASWRCRKIHTFHLFTRINSPRSSLLVRILYFLISQDNGKPFFSLWPWAFDAHLSSFWCFTAVRLLCLCVDDEELFCVLLLDWGEWNSMSWNLSF